MSDTQKAILALNLVSENCKAVLTGLAGKLEDTNGDYPATEFSTLRTDFLSILSLLYAASTKVALALKPDAKAHHAAALVPLRDLSNNVAALLYSIRLMRQTQGSTLLAEYENIARDIISSIEHFAEGLHNSLSQANSNDHFVAVAKVHELIDNAKRSGAMSLDNKTAVRKKLIQDHETLMDVAEEIEEMRQSSGPDDEEGFDDGWEELGLKSNQELSQEERGRLEKVQALVKLTNLLHERIQKDLLSPGSPVQSDALLDRLAKFSSTLLVASDDLISSLYPPHQALNISLHLREYLDLFEELNASLLPSPKLEEQLTALSLTGDAGNIKTTKWFMTCFIQITKAGAKFSETLEDLIPRQ